MFWGAIMRLMCCRFPYENMDLITQNAQLYMKQKAMIMALKCKNVKDMAYVESKNITDII